MREFNFQWHITNACNLRCRHCYQDSFSVADDLNWPELKAIADNILSGLKQWRKNTRINITGGEPLLKKELFPLLDYLNNSPQVEELMLITNGTLVTTALADELAKTPKLKKIKVSLEGGEEVNDAIRGQGIFKKVEAAAAILKNRGFEVTLMLTLMKKNAAEIGRMFDFCRRAEANGLIIERFVPWGQGTKIKNEVLSPAEWEDIVKLVFEFCSLETGNNDEMLPYKAFWVGFSGKEPDLQAAFCNLGDESLCVMPNGDIFPCRRFNLSIGNLRKSALKEIWENTAILQQVRDKNNLKGKCRACSVKACIGCRALAYSVRGDYLAEDPQCWLSTSRG